MCANSQEIFIAKSAIPATSGASHTWNARARVDSFDLKPASGWRLAQGAEYLYAEQQS